MEGLPYTLVEVLEVGNSHHHRDFLEGERCLLDQMSGPLHSEPLNRSDHRLVFPFSEQAAEVAWRDACSASQVFDRERLGEVAFDQPEDVVYGVAGGVDTLLTLADFDQLEQNVPSADVGPQRISALETDRCFEATPE